MSLIAWWPFTQNGHNQGTISTTDASVTMVENGKLGKCAFFNGTQYSSNIDLLTHWNPQQIGVSMACWVKFDYNGYKTIAANTTFDPARSQSTLTGCVIGQASYGGAGIIWTSNRILASDGVTKNELTAIKVSMYMRGGSNTMGRSEFTVPNNTWTHLTYVADPVTKTAYFYINGILKDTRSFSSLAAITGNRTFGINRSDVYGGNGPGAKGPMYVNDVRLYDHTLTPGEIQELSRGLLVHYDFNYLDAGLNLVPNSNDWNGAYTKPDGSGGNAIGISSIEADGSFKVVDNATNTRIRYNTNIQAKKGETYIVSIKHKLLSGDRTFRWQIQELNSSGTVVNTHWSHTTQGYNPVDGEWNTIYYICTVSNVNTIALRFWLQDGADYSTYTHSYQIKDFSIQRISDEIVDSSGNRYNATLVNNCCFLKDTERGKYALQTSQTADGGTQANASYLRGDLGANLTPTALTVSMWAKLNTWGKQTSGLLSLNISSAAQEYTASTIAQRDSHFDFNAAGSLTQYRMPVSGFIIPGEWHHYAIVWDGTKIYGYRDGEEAITPVSASMTSDPFRYIFLGLDRAGGATRDADVTWGEFKLYMTALSADTIKDLATTKAYVFDTGEILSYNIIENEQSTMVTQKGTLETLQICEELNSEYEQLEYLQSTGTQYINTGYIPKTSKIKIDLDMMWTGSTVSTFETFFGFMHSSTIPRMGLHKYSSVLMFGGNATTNSTIAPIKNERILYSADFTSGKQVLYKDNSSIATTSQTYDLSNNTQEAYIFARNASSKNISSMRLYCGKIYENNVLIHYYIPMRRISDKALGLYDVINEQFYINAGSGTFTAGPTLTNNMAAFYESGTSSGSHLIEA